MSSKEETLTVKDVQIRSGEVEIVDDEGYLWNLCFVKEDKSDFLKVTNRDLAMFMKHLLDRVINTTEDDKKKHK